MNDERQEYDEDVRAYLIDVLVSSGCMPTELASPLADWLLLDKANITNDCWGCDWDYDVAARAIIEAFADYLKMDLAKSS